MKQLDAKEQLALFKMYKETGCAELRDRFLCANIPLIKKKVKRLAKYDLDLRKDLEQEAYVGVLEALRSFDPEKGANWATYSLQRAFSRQLTFLAKMATGASGMFTTKKGRVLFPLLHRYAQNDAVVEKAKEKGIVVTEDEVATLRVCREGRSRSAMEFSAYHVYENECHSKYLKIQREKVSVILGKYSPRMTEKEKDILSSLMGEETSLMEVAVKWGVSRQAIQQTRDKLLSKLRPRLAKLRE